MQIGPESLALAVHMNNGLSMPRADVAAVPKTGFGPRLSTVAPFVARWNGGARASHLADRSPTALKDYVAPPTIVVSASCVP